MRNIINIGDKIDVEDELTGEVVEGIVVYREMDNEIPVLHIYLKSDDVNLDILVDNKFPDLYWKIITINLE